MLEYLDANVLWWHWVLFGFVLIGLELLSGTFLMLGLGLAALLTGAAAVIFSMGFVAELFMWATLSSFVVIVWAVFFRRSSDTQSGQPHYRVDTKGTVTEAIVPPAHGRVRFDIPVLGNREWPAFADSPIETGMRVGIVDVSGQLIKVKKEG